MINLHSIPGNKGNMIAFHETSKVIKIRLMDTAFRKSDRESVLLQPHEADHQNTIRI